MREKNIAILLVDDDEVDVMNVKRAFDKNRISNPLYVASNGIEALSMLRAEGVEKLSPAPKVVLLDINMPRMNGIELLEEIRADAKLQSLIVFVLTTSNDDKDRDAAYKLNVAGYILKPVEPVEFLQAVKTLDAFLSIIEFPQN